MITNVDRLTENGCKTEKSDKVCRSRGGESCAFDGAMIVLQPLADTAHLVHGPIACCGNSWEGRGSRSSRGNLSGMGFTTDMNEMDIVYGSGKKLGAAIRAVCEKVKPKAVFVHATCVSGLIGEDIETVCRRSAEEIGIPVIPVSAPGFVGPKNLGNRIAGEVLLEHVIGTGTAPAAAGSDINLIGEYNIAGDLWLVEPVLKKAGFNLLSRITGDATFEEITWAHQAKLNVVVCSRALINIAKGMEQKYGIPYVEVSFFGATETAKALRKIGKGLKENGEGLCEKIEEVIAIEEQKLHDRLRPYGHLRGKRAVLYTGGVKSWSFISALMDLGIEVIAVGTKKSTFEDEEKIKEILGEDAPLVEDVTPKNLKKLMKERHVDMLIAGGRNQYLAVKEGYPFIDVNQERHVAYAGYDGLVNIAEQISSSILFYGQADGQRAIGKRQIPSAVSPLPFARRDVVINPLKHSASIGAAMAFQGIHNALPLIHGSQGCTFLGKVLLTKHFREPIALAGTKLFAEDVVMGSTERLTKTLEELITKNRPDVVGILTSGLVEVKGDDISSIGRSFDCHATASKVVYIPTPDYEGCLETGYEKTITEVIKSLADGDRSTPPQGPGRHELPGPDLAINIIAGPHLTPADFLELREMAGDFGLMPVMLPDLSCLDGSRQGISPLASGGTTVREIASMGSAAFTLVIGRSLEPPARLLKELFGIEYRVFGSLAGLQDTDRFLETLSMLGRRPVPDRYQRQRRILVDGMRDAHAFFGKKRFCLALESDHALQTSRWVAEMGADIPVAVVPLAKDTAELIQADRVVAGDLFSVEAGFDLLIANSHAGGRASDLGIPLMQAGFPVFTVFGNTNRVGIGYRGTLSLIQEAATILAKEEHS